MQGISSIPTACYEYAVSSEVQLNCCTTFLEDRQLYCTGNTIFAYAVAIFNLCVYSFSRFLHTHRTFLDSAYTTLSNFLRMRHLFSSIASIDYFPTNFVVQEDKLYYIDYECNDYMEEWNFENWGIKYWSQTKEFLKYISAQN